MTTYKPDEPGEEERLQAAVDEAKVLGMLDANVEIEQLLDEVDDGDICHVNRAHVAALDHIRHRKQETSGQ